VTDTKVKKSMLNFVRHLTRRTSQAWDWDYSDKDDKHGWVVDSEFSGSRATLSISPSGLVSDAKSGREFGNVSDRDETVDNVVDWTVEMFRIYDSVSDGEAKMARDSLTETFEEDVAVLSDLLNSVDDLLDRIVDAPEDSFEQLYDKAAEALGKVYETLDEFEGEELSDEEASAIDELYDAADDLSAEVWGDSACDDMDDE